MNSQFYDLCILCESEAILNLDMEKKFENSAVPGCRIPTLVSNLSYRDLERWVEWVSKQRLPMLWTALITAYFLCRNLKLKSTMIN